MPSINQLSTISSLSGGTLVPVYDPLNSDARKVSMSAILSYIVANMTGSVPQFEEQYSAPSATGFSVSVTDGSNNVWLVLTPTAGFAAGTIVLPAVANSVANQEVLVNCTQAITTLTVDGNGATAVTGAPTTLAANGFFRMKYDILMKTWYRVG